MKLGYSRVAFGRRFAGLFPLVHGRSWRSTLVYAGPAEPDRCADALKCSALDTGTEVIRARQDGEFPPWRLPQSHRPCQAD